MKSIKTLSILLLAALTLSSCFGNKSAQPSAGGKWGEIRNASAEDVVSSEVAYWTASQTRAMGGNVAPLLFYDGGVAHEGAKSLCISADSYTTASWTNTVNLKPWSKYRFSGWIKTQDIASIVDGGGVCFTFKGVDTPAPVIYGTNDWTQVSFEFETGDSDGATISCIFGTREATVKGKAWFDDMNLELVSSEQIHTSIVVNPSAQGEPMSEYIYGQFIEHLGRCIYGGIWAEMLMDRKFWFAPSYTDSPWRVSDGSQAPTMMRRPPLGAAPQSNLFTMDSSNPFVGAHTPVLVADGVKPVVLEQRNLGVNKGVGLTGYAYLKSDKPMKVVVEMVADGVTKSVELSVSNKYKKYDLKFSAFDKKAKDASFRILPQGAGRLWVGTASLMPDDNVDGFRADVLELLKGLNAPVYRWPGGNFVSGYDWKDGIGPRDQRPPRKNPAWSGVEANDMGLHEFIHFCELIGTDAYVAVNAGLGGIEAAAEEVQYCNGLSSTPMGSIRTLNGSPEPFNVKFWSVGNEMYGDWQLGHTSTESFVEKHIAFAEAMQAEDSTIKLIAVGNVGAWDEMIMANCNDHMDYVSEHFYHTDLPGLRNHALQVPTSINTISQAHRDYRENIPGLAEKDIRICMDEWNFWYGPHIYGELGTRYFLRDALGIAAGLNAFLRNSDIVFMANYAQTVNVIGCIKTTTTDACYAATGEVLKTYRAHFNGIPVEVTGETRPFDVAAAYDLERKVLSVSVINLSYEEHPLNMSFVSDQSIKSKAVKAYSITGPSEMAYNTPGDEMQVVTTEREYTSYSSIKVQACSANIYEISME